MSWRVLVAEGDPTLRKLIGNGLTAPLFEVKIFADAETALVSFRRDKPYDLVFTEYELPGMSGVDLVRSIRATPNGATLPILMAGDRTPREMEMRTRGIGVTSFVAKPFTTIQLHATALTHASKYRPVQPGAPEAAGSDDDASSADPSPSMVIRLPPPDVLAEMLRKRKEK